MSPRLAENRPSTYLHERIIFPGLQDGELTFSCLSPDPWPGWRGRIVKLKGNGETLELGGSPKMKAKQTKIRGRREYEKCLWGPVAKLKKKKDTTHYQYRKTNAWEKRKLEGLVDFLCKVMLKRGYSLLFPHKLNTNALLHNRLDSELCIFL